MVSGARGGFFGSAVTEAVGSWREDDDKDDDDNDNDEALSADDDSVSSNVVELSLGLRRWCDGGGRIAALDGGPGEATAALGGAEGIAGVALAASAAVGRISESSTGCRAIGAGFVGEDAP
jgi:hypothetical protein